MPVTSVTKHHGHRAQNMRLIKCQGKAHGLIFYIPINKTIYPDILYSLSVAAH